MCPFNRSVYSTSSEHLPYYSHSLWEGGGEQQHDFQKGSDIWGSSRHVPAPTPWTSPAPEAAAGSWQALPAAADARLIFSGPQGSQPRAAAHRAGGLAGRSRPSAFIWFSARGWRQSLHVPPGRGPLIIAAAAAQARLALGDPPGLGAGGGGRLAKGTAAVPGSRRPTCPPPGPKCAMQKRGKMLFWPGARSPGKVLESVSSRRTGNRRRWK